MFGDSSDTNFRTKEAKKTQTEEGLIPPTSGGGGHGLMPSVHDHHHQLSAVIYSAPAGEG